MVTALVLVGVELIFFRVAGMVLCFRFVLKTVWLYRDVFAIAELQLHSIKAFFCFLYCFTREKAGAGVAQGYGKGHSTADTNWPKGCYKPCSVMLSI